MSILGDKVARAMEPQLPSGLRAQMAALKEKLGSVTAAAKAAGMDRRTWQRIESGKTRSPKASTGTGVVRELRRVLLGEAKPAEVKVAWKQPGRNRTTTFTERSGSARAGSTSLKPGTGDAIGASLARGDKEGAARAFLDGIEDPWYADMMDLAYEGTEYDDESSSSVAFV